MQMVLHVDWGSCSGTFPTVYVVALCDQLECITQIDPSDTVLAAVSVVKCEPTEATHSVQTSAAHARREAEWTVTNSM